MAPAVVQEVHRWPIPTPFPVGPVNVYYLPGRHPSLVDAGPRTPEATAELERRLRGLPLERLVVTHHHVDHAGLARHLQRTRGVQVFVHAAEADMLAHWETHALERAHAYEAGLVAAAVPPEHLERLRRGRQKYDAWGETVEADATLHHGDHLDLGDATFKVVDAPGHTHGSFLLTEPGGGLTFSGDTLLERITPNAISVRESERNALVQYWTTLRRLREHDWGWIHPGHGTSFRDAAGVIDRALDLAARRRQRILQEIESGALTAYALVERLFPDLQHNQLFLAVSEIRGHLEALRQDGHLQVRPANGADYYYGVKGEP